MPPDAGTAPSRYERILELRAQGWSFARIGKEYGISGEAIRQALKRPTRKRERREPGRRGPPPRISRDEAARLFSAGLSVGEIAVKAGLTSGRVSGLLTEAGVSLEERRKRRDANVARAWAGKSDRRRSPWQRAASLAETITLFREEYGVSQAGFARLMGYEGATKALAERVRRWERGEVEPEPYMRPALFWARRLLLERERDREKRREEDAPA